jgi:CubicO group peptidase (beta-lactamase class C family)
MTVSQQDPAQQDPAQQDPAHPAHDSLRHLVEQMATGAMCPSIAWGVVADGRLVDGADTDIVYRIASMTKSFTCAAVLALRDEGALSLDVPVADYAPELAAVVGPPGSPAITLRHLMSMQSGLTTDDPWADRHLDISAEEIDTVYAAGPAFALQTGTAYEYSNLGFGMIGRVVWRVTGTKVQDHVTRRLLQPLGMHDTTWVEPPHDRWARPFRTEDGEIVPDPQHPLGDGEIAPMGGLWTTVADLARWITWLDLAHGAEAGADDWVGLSPASRREMQRIHTYIGAATLAERPGIAGYGFGVRTFDDPELGVTLAHSGGVPGYGSNMRWLRGRGVGAIALANTTYAPMGELTMRMLVAVAEHGLVPSVPAPSAPALEVAADRLVALLNDWDDTVAHAVFTDNVDMDESFARRGTAARQVVNEHGALRIVEVRPEGATSGSVEVQGRGASFVIDLQLGPFADGRVQFYEVLTAE